nr:RanBP1 domain-containing protein [Ipomoea batatas]
MRDLYWSEEKRVTRSQNGALNGRASISPQNGGRTKSSTVKRRKKEANVVTADQSLSHSNEKLDKIEELRSKDEGEKVEKLRLTSEWEEPKSDVDDYHSYSSVRRSTLLFNRQKRRRRQAGSPFDSQRAEPSQKLLVPTPQLDMQQAESSRQYVMALNTQFVRGFCNGEPDGDWDEARVRNDDEGSSRMRDLYWSEEKRVTRSQNGALNARASISPQNRSRTKSCTVKRQKKEANVSLTLSVFACFSESKGKQSPDSSSDSLPSLSDGQASAMANRDGDWDEARVRNDDEGSSRARMRDLYWSEEKRVTRSQNGALNARALND